MKTFRQFITEGGGDTTTNEIIFNSSDADVLIPLSQTIWERLTGKKGQKYAVHITDWEGLNDLKRISGSKKGLPTMTDLADKEIKKFIETEYGVLTDGGVWVVLKGTPIIELGMDYGTWRDIQGRRWVDVTYKMDRDADLEHNMQVGFRQLREDIYSVVIEAQNDNPELQKEMGSFDPKDPDRWRTDNVWTFNHIGGTNNAGTGKEKALALKMFIDGAEELVRQNLSSLLKVLSKPDMMRFHADWDEIILTKFKIDRMVIEYRTYQKLNVDVDFIRMKFRTKAVDIVKGNEAFEKIKNLFKYVRYKNE
tara:strand:+ start:389 stop:1312 length:924 start_codon:yes stop_codon:yes gene_type:complete